MKNLFIPLSCFILELDVNSDVIWSWIYPKISDEEREFVVRKCKFGEKVTYIFSRHKDNWFYINIAIVKNSDVLDKVSECALILKSTEYNPTKYEKLCFDLCDKYCETGCPVEMQKLYWTISTGNEISSAIKHSCNLKRVGNTKELIQLFALEIILVYNALLLKRRVFVYHDSLSELLKWMQAIPGLILQRDPGNYLFPSVDIIQEELMTLKTSKYYVAGTTESSILMKPELYDVLVNIPAQKILLTPSAKETFEMTKTHKDIAEHMVQLSQDVHLSDEQVQLALSKKTDLLLTQLRSLGTVEAYNEKMISLEYLRSKKFTPVIENFLFNLALAENIMML